jgi:hypothetical protein
VTLLAVPYDELLIETYFGAWLISPIRFRFCKDASKHASTVGAKMICEVNGEENAPRFFIVLDGVCLECDLVDIRSTFDG